MEDVNQEAKQEETAWDRLRSVLPHLSIAIEMAKIEVPDGTVHLGILGRRPDGSGKMLASFECEAFMQDLAEVLGVKDKPGWMTDHDLDVFGENIDSTERP